MPSSYTPSLRLEQPADGEQAGTWGDTISRDLALIDVAIGGITTINTSGGTVALSANNGQTDQSRAAIITLAGSLTATFGLVLPACPRLIHINNQVADNGFYLSVQSAGGGASVSMPGNWGGLLYTDGTNVRVLSTTEAVQNIGLLGSIYGTGGPDPVGAGRAGVAISGSGVIEISAAAGATPLLVSAPYTTPGTGVLIGYYNGAITNIVGSISNNGASTSYNTTSDYRVKAELAPLADAAAQVGALRVYSGVYTAQPGRRVHMLLAHEVAAVVPEAVTGTKDAVDPGGLPVLQQLDASKLVPLLAAGLQDALRRIAQLEQRAA